MKDLLHANVPCVPLSNRKHVDIMLQKYCTTMFWMDFKTFSQKPISCNFRRTTVPKLWYENSKNESKNWKQVFFNASFLRSEIKIPSPKTILKVSHFFERKNVMLIKSLIRYHIVQPLLQRCPASRVAKCCNGFIRVQIFISS